VNRFLEGTLHHLLLKGTTTSNVSYYMSPIAKLSRP
jgi:hypothetical protein